MSGRSQDPSGAAARWAEALGEWGIPAHIEAAAPRDPWRFDPERFARIADLAAEVDTRSVERAREALPEGGSVLDVGCGAGAGSLPLIPPAGHVVGLDPQAEMLPLFTDRVERRGATSRALLGRWPDAAVVVAPVDVAVCHNVLYGIADLVPFALALGRAARARVVIELTAQHPLAWLAPYWRALHDVERPTRPTSDDAAAVLAEAGVAVEVEHWDKHNLLADEDPATTLAFVRGLLCVGRDRDADLQAAMERHPVPAIRRVTTLWWDVGR